MMHRSKLRLKSRGSIGGAVPGGEDQAVLDPSVPGPGLVGFDLTKHEPAADPLELLFDVQLGGVEVHVIPGQAEDFAFAQAENKGSILPHLMESHFVSLPHGGARRAPVRDARVASRREPAGHPGLEDHGRGLAPGPGS
jgi:hypothetical protein